MHLCRKCRRSKLLQVMVLLRLGLVRKKVLLFVNSINEGFRLRLFLEAFGIRSAVLNAELPLNSRHHILQVLGYFVLPIHTCGMCMSGLMVLKYAALPPSVQICHSTRVTTYLASVAPRSCMRMFADDRGGRC